MGSDGQHHDAACHLAPGKNGALLLTQGGNAIDSRAAGLSQRLREHDKTSSRHRALSCRLLPISPARAHAC
ncbi:hypothetical protein CBM2598_U20125 [Cupriavidus taiwanensis]|uniref:Uncharacterized protein n=1 Tax=Cupriavidus taiwanensis TaxID=164546 RepID=A0A375CJP3_9BURK|nr:hypothetical protein CBM2587_P20007 [Cupriavidus taiwanensis]SOZ18703.1 hypothetical protein CBM2597_U20113 [Cupriavidus taiwanensis]SOZ96848.1 hypothetical protein CBM2598_U20125 [Cupriavidus taiwanensis]SPC25985.1 hypothetical protein CBM2594_U30007 [Cupriavidus taiwanensis]